jgi:hypothetical protein
MLTLLLVTVAGCSPAQRVAVGGGIAAVGLGVTYVALESMAGSCSQPRGPDGVCPASSSKPTSPSVAVPGVLAGLGVAVLGVVIMAGDVEHSQPPPTAKLADPAPPENPAALDQSEAVGMAVARMVLAGINGNSKPAKLLGVDDAHSSLRVEGRHAELWNLRVHSAADETWRTVGACYEYENEWRLTSLGTTLGCPH